MESIVDIVSFVNTEWDQQMRDKIIKIAIEIGVISVVDLEKRIFIKNKEVKLLIESVERIYEEQDNSLMAILDPVDKEMALVVANDIDKLPMKGGIL